jgi:hypothetical protein
VEQLDFEYNVVIESDDVSAVVNWGHEPGWIEAHRDLLEAAHTISLLPKDASSVLPVVSARLGDGRRWVIFSRVYGAITGPNRVRLYCIGWQTKVKGVNVKSLMWVYPTGAVECAEEPTHWQRFLQ